MRGGRENGIVSLFFGPGRTGFGADGNLRRRSVLGKNFRSLKKIIKKDLTT